MHTGLASGSFIRRAHRAGKQVFVWTVNDPINMSRMIGRGVDGIITDEPALLNRMGERAELSSPERLLLEAAFWMGMVPKDPWPEVDAGSEAVEKVIVSDLSLIRRRGRRDARCAVQVSSVASCHNSEAARFYRDLEASRIIFPGTYRMNEAAQAVSASESAG